MAFLSDDAALQQYVYSLWLAVARFSDVNQHGIFRFEYIIYLPNLGIDEHFFLSFLGVAILSRSIIKENEHPIESLETMLHFSLLRTVRIILLLRRTPIRIAG